MGVHFTSKALDVKPGYVSSSSLLGRYVSMRKEAKDGRKEALDEL